ncbi:putative NADH dehydrogenase [ubiquinone] 1 alpha subcomplex subunit 12-like protein [Leptotrombidium deliense]|uniref:NADH dehydrogenase [ubiquinone] 1 alpha subcomplex subunit 12 n=1 Tax=Leptotrombidium deliense TaxID=299467 RepID=A0A443SFB9_9ACAR|nr:putative NADH dehydrogenase [ubiquinone] 1 alpha subcomplex subunit 12-like protein [Leptotrombidium deliense]
MGKIANFFKAIKHNRGPIGSLNTLWRMDVLKWGKLVGEDKYGNKYYQNNYFPYAKNRWVVYNEKCFWDYDGSQVPAEWHNWLHYMTDDTPTEKPRVQYDWMMDHTENMSGTSSQYVPYTTVPQKIKMWAPDGKQLKLTAK